MLVTPDTAVEVYSVTRDRWKSLRVQNSFTGAFTPSCVLSGDGGGVTVFGGINTGDVTRPVMDNDLHRLRLQCGAGGSPPVNLILENVSLPNIFVSALVYHCPFDDDTMTHDDILATFTFQVPGLCVMTRSLAGVSTLPGSQAWAGSTPGEWVIIIIIIMMSQDHCCWRSWRRRASGRDYWRGSGGRLGGHQQDGAASGAGGQPRVAQPVALIHRQMSVRRQGG